MVETQIEKYHRSLFLLVAFLLTAVLLLPNGSAGAATLAPITVQVEGKTLVFPQPPVIIEGRTLVGVRSVGEAVGGTVTWDENARKATVTRRSDTVVLTLGDKNALVNGQTVVMEVPAQLIGERTMVPLRFIAEALGGTVEWNDATRTANILRKPTAITGMSYTTDVGKATLKLTLSEPLDSITPKAGDTSLTLDLYPALIQVDPPVQAPMDQLMTAYGLQADGRTVHLAAQLWAAPLYSYSLSPDGTQLTIEFRYSVTGIQYQMDGRTPTVNIATSGKVNYTTQVLKGPDRLVIDLPGTALSPQAPAGVDGGQPLVTRVRTGYTKDPVASRVVIELSKAHTYDIVSTSLGLQIRFVPRIVDVRMDKLPGKTRLTFLTTLPVDAQATVPAGTKQMLIGVTGGVNGLASNNIKLGDGGVDTVTAGPGPSANTTLLTVNLAYYLGHTVVSQPNDSNIVIDLISSPVFGKRIWIDAGHGNIPGGRDDPGTIGTTYGTKEKVINLAVALELQKMLQDAGAIVYMTRTGDAGVDYTDRPALVNAVNPAIDIFISVHHNAMPSNSTVRGIETYYWTTNPKSRALADKVHSAIVKNLGFLDRKVRLMDFYVIKQTKAPAILVECGYLSSPAEEKAVAEPGVAVKTYPTRAAEGIKNGVFDYFWQEIKPAGAN